ncbi:MAG: LexA family transcriptional regulator [Nitrospinae bacterium]|nr:LexA family transcriptional regulator [Nitrospinota bacterium]
MGIRIKNLREYCALTQKEFAAKLGVAQTVISRYERGTIAPHLDTVFLMVNSSGLKPSGRYINWLLSGENVFNNHQCETLEELISYDGSPVVAEKPAGANSPDFIKIPLHGVFASLGPGAIVDEEHIIGWRAFSREWLSAERLDAKNLACIEARGDSMDPAIKDRDTLLVDTSISAVADDAIYILQKDGTLVAKRLQKLYDGSILVKSENPIYSTETVPREAAADTLRIVGRVVALMRRI